MDIIDQFFEADKVKREASDRALELVLAQLKLYATICRIRVFRGSPLEQQEYELKARLCLGRAIALVSHLELTPEQNDRFGHAFRALTLCLPIRSPAKVIPIDCFEDSNSIANVS